MKNTKVKLNLEKLLDLNIRLLSKLSVEKFIQILIDEPPMAFNMNSGEITGSYDEEEIKNLIKAKKNLTLISAFEKIKSLKYDETKIIENFKNDIYNSVSEIKDKINTDNKGFKNQIIFLEHDLQPFAYFCGFGKGNYPILDSPALFEYNYKEELYNGIGKIDYSEIWTDLLNFNEILEELNIFDQIIDTEFYQAILNCVHFKTYLLLHEAFHQIGIEAFNGIEIEKPLFIYANEHDCEAMNIAIIE